MIGREGSYPPPPRWHDKLCTIERDLPTHPLHPFLESDAVQHDYIADGCPGPCVISFRNDAFAGWWPYLTVERAERFGEAL